MNEQTSVTHYDEDGEFLHEVGRENGSEAPPSFEPPLVLKVCL
ncbi:hypothetical protein [Salipaludibacillus sp. LMS25]|nr:hypothetical protein [Salipaludibacillus sp. LMS25]